MKEDAVRIVNISVITSKSNQNYAIMKRLFSRRGNSFSILSVGSRRKSAVDFYDTFFEL